MTEFDIVSEAREVVVRTVKADLAAKVTEIPSYVWARRYPNSQIILQECTDSQYLTGITGHDVVQTFLNPDGQIFEKLVHYSSDGYDDDKDDPDEILGETSDDRYLEAYDLAIHCIEASKND